MRAALLLMTFFSASGDGQEFGVWILNAARSTPPGNQKSLTLRIEPDSRGEVFTLDIVAADGRASTFSTILYLDGHPRDFQGRVCSGSQSSRRIDSDTVEILRKCSNGAWIRFLRRSAAPAKVLTLEITEQNIDGRRVEQHLVLEKQVLKKP